MIIKNDGSHRRFHLPSRFWLWPAAAVGICLVIWIVYESRSSYGDAPPLLYCDAEKVENGRFVNAGYLFSNGQTQSADYAHSGRYSSKLPPGEGARYGLSYDWHNFERGARYEVSIWRRQFGSSIGRLVVSADGPAGFYRSASEPETAHPDGWEQLRLQFTTPPAEGLEKINIHVYTDGPDSVYFDDLKLTILSPADFSAFTPRRLYLQVDSDGMNQLQQKRAEALAKGILETEAGDWVRARFREDGQDPIPVEVRLKGDWLDHLRGDKWSFRIKCRSGGSWNRLVTFSLHTPAARYFLHEWMLHQIWEQEGVLTSRYDFAELFLNGVSLGIYAYEEHFEKQLVEYRQRREGPILKFSEAGFWAGVQRQLQHHGFVRPNSGHTTMEWENAPIEAFNENDLPDAPLLQEQFFTAAQRLEKFRRGEYLASDLFDLDLLAKYFAISDLLQAYHGIAWHNQRFYYNPVSDLMEPIGFDGFGEQPEIRYTFLGEGALHPQGPLSETFFSYVFQDTAFTARYIRYLDQYTEPGYLQTTLDRLAGEWNRRLAYLQQEFPTYQPQYDELDEQAQYIRSLLHPFDQYSLKARTAGRTADQTQIELINAHILPLEVVGYGIHDGAPLRKLKESMILPAQTPRRLLARTRTTGGRINDWSQLKYIGEESRIAQGLPVRDTISAPHEARYLFYRVLGLPSLYFTSIHPRQMEEVTPRPVFLPRNRPLTPHASFEQTGNDVYFRPGKHQIDTPLFFPPGLTLHLPAGTELDFLRGGMFVSQSPVLSAGSRERPVRFYSSDGLGQGLVLINVHQQSSFLHTSFSSLQVPQQGGWQLTGAVTIYEANVRFQNCSFENMPGEDALNLIRSNFVLDECRFSQNASDGLDSDFCKGEIRNSIFQQMVNDGLDLSGSIVEVSDCRFRQCGDKGISIGEESDVTILDTEIISCPIAVACKDLSTAFLKNIALADCPQGFAAFQKKPEFGPAFLFVESHTARDVDRLYNIAPGSSLQLGDRLIK